MYIFVRRLLYWSPLLAATLLFTLWHATSPLEAGPLGMLVVFILVYIFCLGSFFIILHSSESLLKRVARAIGKKHTGESLHFRRSYYIASVLAFMPVFLIAMHSVGQLRLQDVLLIIGFVLIAIFYVTKRS